MDYSYDLQKQLCRNHLQLLEVRTLNSFGSLGVERLQVRLLHFGMTRPEDLARRVHAHLNINSINLYFQFFLTKNFIQYLQQTTLRSAKRTIKIYRWLFPSKRQSDRSLIVTNCHRVRALLCLNAPHTLKSIVQRRLKTKSKTYSAAKKDGKQYRAKSLLRQNNKRYCNCGQCTKYA